MSESKSQLIFPSISFQNRQLSVMASLYVVIKIYLQNLKRTASNYIKILKFYSSVGPQKLKFALAHSSKWRIKVKSS